ncbi:hypothetical protein L873DRAFT_1779010 [Choiromyces venosus 120613-1]|uniref:Mid2 domain-containing protein n=1 Tax=Choiromyces venosus 120613-1 TaxID=1336337 RepID=A0A3N4J3M1_9PEZI|nr:hypothetical protein L873DRAFT_1779010 [Choiromyces venosus 120613-1]
MSISEKLRLAYVAEWLLVVSVSAVPVEYSPTVEADGTVVVMLEKREENSESLNRVINEAVGRDHAIVSHGGDGDGDGDNDGDSAHGSFTGEPPSGNTTFHLGPSKQADLLPARLEEQQGPSTAAKHLMIAGGAIAAFIFVAAIAFWLYKTKDRIFRKANFKCWKRGGGAHRLRGGDTMYDEKSSVYPQSTIFGGGGSTRPGAERKHSIPGMPFPPPAALAPSDGSLERRQSRKRLLIRTSLLPKNQPVSPVSPIDEKGTFYDGASDASSTSQQQKQPPLPPPVYMTDHPLLSPSQSSSISNIKPRKPPTTNQASSYAKMYPPPPIPTSSTPRNGNAQQAIDSRFSWTTSATSEAPNGAKSVRSSVDSEPRFRGVNSWVSHQAGRLERSERLAQLQLEQEQQQGGGGEVQLGSSPGTPRAFRHHPGAPVSFSAHQARKESADLDKQLLQSGR